MANEGVAKSSKPTTDRQTSPAQLLKLRIMVKQPLPSVQLKENHTVIQQDFQPIIKGRKQISQTGHLSEDE